jgi:hypothetical protein
LEIKNFEQSFLSDLSDEVWKQYAENKDTKLMEQAQEIEEASKKAKEQALEAVKILADVRENSEVIKKTANDAGVHTLELETHVQPITAKLDSVEDIHSYQALEDAYKEGGKAVDNTKKLTLDLNPTLFQNLFGMYEKLSDALLPGSFYDYYKELERETFYKIEAIILSELSSSKPTGLGPTSDEDFLRLFNVVKSKLSLTEQKILIDYIDDAIIKEQQNNEINKIIGDTVTITDIQRAKKAYELFGLSNFSSKPDDSFVAPPEPEGKNVSVLVIGGKNYPALQFNSAHPDACTVLHYHSPFPKVYSVDLYSITDPDKPKCGFGPVDSVPVTEVFMTKAQIDAFVAATGLSP